MSALTIIPGIILLIIVWKFDSVEKEPISLLLKLFFCGALTVISAIAIRLLCGKALSSLFENRSSIWFLMIDSFLLTALVQEGGKFIVLKLITWKNKAFNYTFDAVVYSVAVSLGFAVCLNIVYAFRFGPEGSLIRIIFSVPGHAMNAVFMGYFYGLARYSKGRGDEKAVKMHILEAVLIPVIVHGFYDLCVSADKTIFYVLFVIYEILLTVTTVRQFIKLSKTDTLIPGMEYTVNIDWDSDEK